MVDFQPDSNRFTSGDGTFYLDYLDNEDVFVDPLPHNQAYFESHLQFAKNYFSTVSSDQVDLEFEVIPQVFTLPQKMEAYAPLDDEENGNQKLANLIQQSWELVGQSGAITSEMILPNRTAFIIFHAGVGRDIELLGTTLDKTPQDIPSLTLNSNSIRRLFPNSSGWLTVPGIPSPISNTLILPATQSRQGSNIDDSKFILQLSTNGLICASIGSFLGLPDLFNTDDGQSAIGQFGLMDGAGFFANFGLFPPEPSAWEKQHLGWISPPEIDTKIEQTIPLNHVSDRNGQTTVKIPIDEFEYYLVENRHRDPDGTGVTLTIRTAEEGDKSVTYTNFDEYFRFFDTDSLKLDYPPGVLISVSNYDWALPGGLDYGEDGRRGNGDDRLLNGGILIWHIDEAVIQNGLEENTINNNPLRRGVDLEEADGAQDIGLPNAVTEISGIQNGSPFDFWWSGNDARVILPSGLEIQLYENRFGDDTEPNNRSNSGQSVGFEFFDFSDNQPQASFKIRPAEQVGIPRVLDIKLSPNQWQPLGKGISQLIIESDTLIIIPGDDAVYSINLSNPTVIDSITTFYRSHQPILLPDGLFLINYSEVPAARYRYENGEWRIVWQVENLTSGDMLGRLVFEDSEHVYLPSRQEKINIESGQVSPSDLPKNALVSDFHTDQLIFLPSSMQLREKNSGKIGSTTITDPWLIGTLRHADNSYNYLIVGNETVLVGTNGDVLSIDQTFETRTIFSSIPTLFDADEDGNVDVMLTTTSEQIILNRNFGRISNTTFLLKEHQQFVGSALIYKDTFGNKIAIRVIRDGYRHRIVAKYIFGGGDSFVWEADADVDLGYNQAIMAPAIVGDRIYYFSTSGRLFAWRIPDFSEGIVTGLMGSSSDNSYFFSASAPQNPKDYASLLVKEETYNWPNPANESTQIRFFTSEPAEIDIVILSMSGTIVTRMQTNSMGTAPQEQTLSTANLGSGIYLARITAKSTATGKSDTKIIRIAVIH